MVFAFRRSASCQHFVFPHFNLRTVLALMSHTSTFLWTYRRCQALTYVMIIGLWPGNIFLQAFQQLSIVPARASTFGLRCWQRHTVFATWSVPTQVQKTCLTYHEVCQAKYRKGVQRNMKRVNRSTVCYRRRVQRTMKCVNPSTEDVSNVPWSVPTQVQYRRRSKRKSHKNEDQERYYPHPTPPPHPIQNSSTPKKKKTRKRWAGFRAVGINITSS